VVKAYVTNHQKSIKVHPQLNTKSELLVFSMYIALCLFLTLLN